MPLFTVTFALLGISLGTPASTLRPTLGDPILIEKTSNISRTADYLRAGDIAAVVRVTERDGVVFAVEVERERPEPTLGAADAHGIALGMSRRAVAAKRGKPAFETMNTELYPEDPNEDASIVYRFDGDTLESIKLVGSGTTAAGDPSLPPLTETAGAGFDSAILDLSPTPPESDHYRDRYLTVHGCDVAGRSVSYERRDGRTYAIAGAACAGKQRTFYFDITRARPA